MPSDLYGALRPVAFMGQLEDTSQGDPKLILPAAWSQTQVIAFRQIGIWFQATPANQHSFSFFKNGGLISAVTVTTSGNFWRTDVNFFLTGQADNWSVRHDTNAQDADEMSGTHVNEGGRIMAFIIPAD